MWESISPTVSVDYSLPFYLFCVIDCCFGDRGKDSKIDGEKKRMTWPKSVWRVVVTDSLLGDDVCRTAARMFDLVVYLYNRFFCPPAVCAMAVSILIVWRYFIIGAEGESAYLIDQPKWSTPALPKRKRMKRGLRNRITIAITRSHRNGPPRASRTLAVAARRQEEVPTTLSGRLLGNWLALVREEILAEATEQEPGLRRRPAQLQRRGEEEEELPAAWMFLRRRAVCPGTSKSWHWSP